MLSTNTDGNHNGLLSQTILQAAAPAETRLTYSYPPDQLGEESDLTADGRSMAERFLTLLAEGEEVTFQTVDDSKPQRRDLTEVLHGDLDSRWDELAALNQRGAGVFVTVNATDLKGRRAENITQVRAFFVDLDDTPLDVIRSAPLQPHMTIESSPGRYHAYWMVDGATLEQFKPVQQHLAQRFNGDKSVIDLPRVMRLPGFMHRKGEPFMTRIIETKDYLPYPVCEFIAAFGVDLESLPMGASDGSGPRLGIEHDPVLKALQRGALLLRQLTGKQGAWEITCPWADEHSKGSGYTATYFEAHTHGHPQAAFNCFHNHCAHRTIHDLREKLGVPPDIYSLYFPVEKAGSNTVTVEQNLGSSVPASEQWPEPQPLPIELPTVKSFDTTLLPEAFRPWIDDISERMQCPPDFPAVGAMVAIASIVGRQLSIRPKRQDDWTIIPNLWGGVVGKPGVMKTPALNEPKRMLNELEIVAKLEYLQKQQEWIALNDITAAKKKVRKKAIQEAVENQNGDPKAVALSMLDIEEPPPVRRRFVTNDPTVEKLGELLNENPNGLMIYRDELAGFLRNLDKDGHENDRAFYLEAWNGDGRYTYDRIGRGTIDIDAACVSMLGGIQPGPLSAYLSSMARGGAGDDGFMQRFQLLVYPDIAKAWRSIDRRPNMEARNRATHIFHRLSKLDAHAVGAQRDYATDDSMPYLRFADDAQAAFTAWLVQLNLRLRSDDEPPAIIAHLAKFQSLIPSLALLIHLVDGASGPVGLSALQAAIGWGSYLEGHARRIYSPAIASDMAAARLLARKMEQGAVGDEFSLRDIYRHNWSGLGKEALQTAVALLVEYDWLGEKRESTGGRTRITYLVNPALLKKKAA